MSRKRICPSCKKPLPSGRKDFCSGQCEKRFKEAVWRNRRYYRG